MLDTSISSTNFYFLVAVFQGFILAAIIIFQKPRRTPNFFIGMLIFFFSLSLLHLILEESIHIFNAKFPIPMDFSLSYGPLAYFHVRYIKNPMLKFTWRHLVHFLPSLLLDVIFFSSMFLYLGRNTEWAYNHIEEIQSVGLTVALLGAVQLAIYTYLIFKESQETKSVLREFEKLKDWLKYLIIAWSVFIVFLTVAVPISLVFIEYLDENSAFIYKPLSAINGLCIYFLGYLYLLKYVKLVNTYTDKAVKFNFSETELIDKKEEILNAIANQKVYQDPKITLAKLAGILGWPINSVSRMINESLNTNFNDLINQYRIKAFRELVLHPESKKYSILGLGQEVGFSSKASFYRAFKKETGMTPSDFLKSQE